MDDHSLGRCGNTCRRHSLLWMWWRLRKLGWRRRRETHLKWRLEAVIDHCSSCANNRTQCRTRSHMHIAFLVYGIQTIPERSSLCVRTNACPVRLCPKDTNDRKHDTTGSGPGSVVWAGPGRGPGDSLHREVRGRGGREPGRQRAGRLVPERDARGSGRAEQAASARRRDGSSGSLAGEIGLVCPWGRRYVKVVEASEGWIKASAADGSLRAPFVPCCEAATRHPHGIDRCHCRSPSAQRC